MKKLAAKSWVLVGIGSLLMLLLAWIGFSFAAVPARSVKGLALRSAAGDTNAAATLKQMGPKAVPALVELLRWKDPFFKRVAYTISPNLPNRLRRGLMARVGPINSGRMRVAGARGLALLGAQAESALPDLLLTLHDPEPYISMEAAASLARMDYVAVPGLRAALLDKSPVVRRSAAYALGEMGAPALPVCNVLAATLDDSDVLVRSSAAYSLSRIELSEINLITNLLYQPKPAAQEKGIQELVRMFASLRQVEAPLGKMAKAEDDASRNAALQALAIIRSGDNLVIRTLVEAADNPTASIRLAATKGLSEVPFRSQSVVDAVNRLRNDSDPEVRACAVSAFAGASSTNGSLGERSFKNEMPVDSMRTSPGPAPFSRMSGPQK